MAGESGQQAAGSEQQAAGSGQRAVDSGQPPAAPLPPHPIAPAPRCHHGRHSEGEIEDFDRGIPHQTGIECALCKRNSVPVKANVLTWRYSFIAIGIRLIFPL